jgi:hypothetical protein
MDKEDVIWLLKSYDGDTGVLIKCNDAFFSISAIDYDKNVESLIITVVPIEKADDNG